MITVFMSSLSTKKISKTHKKKLNSVCTGLMFTLALLAVFIYIDGIRQGLTKGELSHHVK